MSENGSSQGQNLALTVLFGTTTERDFREAIYPENDAALEASQGRNDSFFSQRPYKCYLEEVASVGD